MYLIKVNENDEREITLTTVDMTGDEIENYIAEGYFLVRLENFNKLIGNTGKFYKISHIDGSVYEIEQQKTNEEEQQAMIQAQLTAAVQNWMDKTVQARNYDNIHTACTYVNSTDETFKAEGTACLAWRDEVWRSCYNILNDVLSGQREIPTEEELIAELPKLEW